MITAKTVTIGPSPDQWNLPEGVEKFSENHIYYAHRVGYDKGVSAGREEEIQILTNRIQNNITITTNDTYKVLNKMMEMGITPISAHMKVLSGSALKVLVTVSDGDFVKETFEDLYLKVREIEESSKTDVYSVCFTFINRSSSFNTEQLQLEGFKRSFRPLEETRKK